MERRREGTERKQKVGWGGEGREKGEGEDTLRENSRTPIKKQLPMRACTVTKDWKASGSELKE